MDIYKLTYDDFIKDADYFNNLLSKNMEILKFPQPNAEFIPIYQIIQEIEKYYCFVLEIYNSKIMQNTNNDTKLVNLRNIFYSSLELVRDILQLMSVSSFYGVNILLRTVYENNIVSWTLFNGDDEMSKSYYDWQIRSLNKINKSYKTYTLVSLDLENLKKGENKIKDDNKEYEKFKQKYKDCYDSDYGWAFNFFKRTEPNLKPLEINLDYLANKFDGRAIPFFKLLNSYSHMTSFQVHSNILEKILENNAPMSDAYYLPFLYLPLTLNIISFIQLYTIEENHLEIKVKQLYLISQYYNEQCQKTIDLASDKQNKS